MNWENEKGGNDMRIYLFIFLLSSIPSLHSQVEKLPMKMEINDSAYANGYYFMAVTTMRKTSDKPSSVPIILNGKGELIYYHQPDQISDFKLQTNGLISYFCRNKFFLMDSTFTLIDSVSCVNGIETDSHDFQILPNGNFLLIGTDSSREDLGHLSFFTDQKKRGNKNALVKYGVVQELDRNKKLVYEWRSRPFYKPEEVSPIYPWNPNLLDVTHFNSIDVFPNGDYLISVRYSNEIICVNRQEGTIRWHLGGKYNSFVESDSAFFFYGQHDARVLANGQISLFDNGYGTNEEKHPARALILELDLVEKRAIVRYSYTFSNQLTSQAAGNADVHPDGTVLLGFGRVQNLSPNYTCALADKNQNTVVTISFGDTLCSYRVFRYDTLPFKWVQPKLKLVDSPTGWYLTTEKNEIVRWNNGETAYSFAINKPGIYYAYVYTGTSGMIRTESFTVSEEMLHRGRKSK
jgi:Arylsulfotransferase (ASST)